MTDDHFQNLLTLIENYYLFADEEPLKKRSYELFRIRAMHSYRVRIDRTIDKIMEQQGATNG